jgi:hypothetical protein
VGTVYLDMSKAFDRISHVKLFSKLDNYRFSGSLLKCFQSYLTGRRQRVIIFGVTSNTVPILSGPLSCFLRIQYMIQSKTQVETVKFRIYFKVMFRQNEIEYFTRNMCTQQPLAYIFQTLFQHEVFVITPTLNAGSRCSHHVTHCNTIIDFLIFCTNLQKIYEI